MTYKYREVPDFRAIAKTIFDLRRKIAQVQLTGSVLISSIPWEVSGIASQSADRQKVEKFWPPLRRALQQLVCATNAIDNLDELISEFIKMNPQGNAKEISKTLKLLLSIPNEIIEKLDGGNGQMPFIPDDGPELDKWLDEVTSFAKWYEKGVLRLDQAVNGTLPKNRPGPRFPVSPLTGRSVIKVDATKYL